MIHPPFLFKELAQAAVSLLLAHPFYGHLLHACSRAFTETGTRSIGVCWEEGGWLLRIHPAYWKGLTAAQQEAALQHQLLHLLFNHPAEVSAFPDPFLFDVAADLVVNQYIPSEKRPAGWVDLHAFPGWPLTPEKSTAYYYERLHGLREEGGKDFPEAFTYLGALERARGEHFDGHQAWHAPQEGAELGLMERSIRARFMAGQEVAAGDLPGGLLRRLEALQEGRRTTLDWRRALRLFSQSSRRTITRETLHRPSKRYGRIPGLRVRRRQKLLVALDTSGSVSGRALSLFWEELERIVRTGAEVEVLEFDAAIQRVYPFSRRPPKGVRGGGGTDFVSLIEYANRQRGSDALIVFTDGFAPTPRVPCRTALLWLITPNGIAEGSPLFRALPGRKFKLAL